MEERNDRLIRWVLGLLLPWRRREVCAYAVRQYLAPATVKLCSFVVVGTDSEHVFSKTHEPTVITTTATANHGRNCTTRSPRPRRNVPRTREIGRTDGDAGLGPQGQSVRPPEHQHTDRHSTFEYSTAADRG